MELAQALIDAARSPAQEHDAHTRAGDAGRKYQPQSGPPDQVCRLLSLLHAGIGGQVQLQKTLPNTGELNLLVAGRPLQTLGSQGILEVLEDG